MWCRDVAPVLDLTHLVAEAVHPTQTMEALPPAKNDQVQQSSRPKQNASKRVGTCREVDEGQFQDVELEKESFGEAIGGAYANRPHPMLETPVCYNILKRFTPALLDNLRNPYSCRWRCSYPLQRRLPYSRFLDNKIGVHLTWGEVLLVLPFCCSVVSGLSYSVVFPSVAASGKIARAALIASVTLANRTNSVATFLLGMPFDRALYYHKLSGKLAGVASVLHVVAFYLDPKYQGGYGLLASKTNASGTIMFALLVGIVLTSLPWTRRRFYEMFYVLHRVCAFGMVVGAFYHSGKLVPCLTALTWGVDVVLRKAILTNKAPVEARIEVVSNTVVRLTFDKGSFDYNPGQYVYISIPEISWLQWHPFSMNSAPHEDVVEFQIRAVGDWTRALHRLAEMQSVVPLYLQGPYGNIGVDLLAGDRKYKNVVLVSGGIGITPMQSVLDQLLAEHNGKVRVLEHLVFLWIERDASFLEHESEIIINKAEHTQDNLSSRLLSMIGKSKEDGAQEDSEQSPKEGSFSVQSGSLKVEIKIYLTKGTVPSHLKGIAQRGRPDLPKIFADLASQSSGKTAVLSSAPHRVMDICRSACIEHSNDRVRFDFHSESMAI